MGRLTITEITKCALKDAKHQCLNPHCYRIHTDDGRLWMVSASWKLAVTNPQPGKTVRVETCPITANQVLAVGPLVRAYEEPTI